MKKIYIEISDICGLKCSFCPAPKGIRGVMNLGLFKKAVAESSRYTKLIALHILGDPLSVENLEQYLAVAKSANLSVEITTSGANLANLKNFDLLLNPPIKQVNFSLDALNELKNRDFLLAWILDFCKYKKAIKSQIFINLRIQKRARNMNLVAFLEREFGIQNLAQYLSESSNKSCESKCAICDSRVKLGDKIIIDFRGVFKWGDLKDLKDSSLRESASADSWQSKTSDLKKQNELRTEKRINADSLQVSDSQNAQSLPDSLPRFCVAKSRNDCVEVDCFGNELPRNDEVVANCHESLHESCNDESIAESKNANSSIVSEKSGLRSHEQGNKTDSLLTKRVASLHDLSPQDEFATIKGTCLALKTHIGILSNGEIVPCCMDFAGILSLGNIKDTTLDSALKSKKAQKMLDGFRQNRIVEAFCASCDYRKRFDSHIDLPQNNV